MIGIECSFGGSRTVSYCVGRPQQPATAVPSFLATVPSSTSRSGHASRSLHGPQALTVMHWRSGATQTAPQHVGRATGRTKCRRTRDAPSGKPDTHLPSPTRRCDGDQSALRQCADRKAHRLGTFGPFRSPEGGIAPLQPPPPPLGVCIWIHLVNGTDNSPVSGTADPRSSQTGQVIRGLR